MSSLDGFPSNSRRPIPSAAEPEKTEGVTEEEPKLSRVEGIGRVVVRKKSFGKRLLDTFFRGNDGVLPYLVREVLVPAAQTLITDIVVQGVERAVWGEARTPIRRPVRGVGTSPFGAPRGPHVSYDQVNRPSTIVRGGPQQQGLARRSVPQPGMVDIGEVVLENNFGAQTVVEKLYETMEEYGAVTVANFKELLGMTAPYTDHKWGWGQGADFRIRRVREGFMIEYPEPQDLR